MARNHVFIAIKIENSIWLSWCSVNIGWKEEWDGKRKKGGRWGKGRSGRKVEQVCMLLPCVAQIVEILEAVLELSFRSSDPSCPVSG